MSGYIHLRSFSWKARRDTPRYSRTDTLRVVECITGGGGEGGVCDSQAPMGSDGNHGGSHQMALHSYQSDDPMVRGRGRRVSDVLGLTCIVGVSDGKGGHDLRLQCRPRRFGRLLYGLIFGFWRTISLLILKTNI